MRHLTLLVLIGASASAWNSTQRHAALWYICEHDPEACIANLAPYNSSYDTISANFALIGNVTEPFFVPWANAASEAVHEYAVAALGWRPVPMLTICCGCIIAKNYTALLANLTAEAVSRGFAGYVLDMECGSHDNAELQVFFSLFATMLGGDREVSWFAHGSWAPWEIKPITWHGYCFSEDTYARPDYAGKYWMPAFGPMHCGVGLENSCDLMRDANYSQWYFESYLLEKNVTSVGTWGLIGGPAPLNEWEAQWAHSQGVFLRTPYTAPANATALLL